MLSHENKDRLCFAVAIVLGVLLIFGAWPVARGTACFEKQDGVGVVRHNESFNAHQNKSDTGISTPTEGPDEHASHQTNHSDAAENEYWPYTLLCGEMKLTDLALVFFTYCLVVVGWFTMKSNERTSQDIERSHVFLAIDIKRRWITNLPGGQNFEVRFAFKNHGKTHAIVVKIEAEVRTVAKLPESIREQAIEMPPGLTIGAGETTEEFRVINHVTDADFAMLPNGGRVVLFVGTIQYRDIFGKLHSTGFCHNWNPVLGGLTPSPTRKSNYFN